MGIVGTWIGIARLFSEYLHFFPIPSDAFHFSGTRIGNILALLTPGFPSLKGNSYRFSSSGLVGGCVIPAPKRWLEILSKRPTE
jgi:hypothetical protein